MSDRADLCYQLARAALAARVTADAAFGHVRAIGVNVTTAEWRRVWTAATNDHNTANLQKGGTNP